MYNNIAVLHAETALWLPLTDARCLYRKVCKFLFILGFLMGGFTHHHMLCHRHDGIYFMSPPHVTG